MMTDDASTWLHALRPDALKHLCPYPRHLNGIADVLQIGVRLIRILGGLILVPTVHSTLLPFCSVLESPLSVLGRFLPPLRLNLTLVRALNAILHASVTAVLREVFGDCTNCFIKLASGTGREFVLVYLVALSVLGQIRSVILGGVSSLDLLCDFSSAIDDPTKRTSFFHLLALIAAFSVVVKVYNASFLILFASCATGKL